LYTYFFWGAIYVPTSEEKVEKMVKFLKIKPGQTVVDLGSGDGRLLIALAKAGANAYGYEINPLLVTSARKNIKKAGLGDKAFVYCKSLWRQDLKDFDAVVVYPMAHMMRKLEKKFERELKSGVKIVSNYFTLPTWKPDKVEDNVYLYIKK
jgi:ribosomal protein L11 methylase PrmA